MDELDYWTEADTWIDAQPQCQRRPRVHLRERQPLAGLGGRRIDRGAAFVHPHATEAERGPV
jgi:hypothetical protein